MGKRHIFNIPEEHVARPKSTELAERDETILEMAAQGYTQRKIASTLGISAARVNQVLREARESIDPDAARAKLGEILDDLLEVSMNLVRGPGKRMVSPSGMPVYELDPESEPNRHGKHAPDLTKPLFDEYARLEGVKQVNETARNYARIFGLEIKPKEKDDSEAMNQVAHYIGQLEQQVRDQAALLEQLQPEVVEGEIVS